MEKWDYPGIHSKQKSRIPKVPKRLNPDDDYSSTAGSGSATPVTGSTSRSASGSGTPVHGSTSAGGSGTQPPSSTTPTASSSQPHGSSEAGPSRTPSSQPVIPTASTPPRRQYHPEVPTPPPRPPPPSFLRTGLRDLSKIYPESPAGPSSWDDGTGGDITSAGPTKPRGQVRFGNVEVREVTGPGGPYGPLKPKRKPSPKSSAPRGPSPTSSSHKGPSGRRDPSSPPSSRRDPSSPPSSRRHSGTKPSPTSPSPRRRKRRGDTSSMRPMSPENISGEGWSREFSPSVERHPYLKRKSKARKHDQENKPKAYTPKDSSQRLPPGDPEGPKQEDLLTIPEAAETARDRAAIEERRRERELSRERAVEEALRHEMASDQAGEERGRDTSPVGGSSRAERPRRERHPRSRSPPRERDFMDPGPGDPPGGDTGAGTQEQPEGEAQKPEEPEKSTEPQDEKPKKEPFLHRLFAKHRVRVLPPKNGKLTKVPDSYSFTKERELNIMSPQQKRVRKLLQIKRRLNHYGMLATVVTSIYLICFGVAWQEHHRWNIHDRERRPVESQPFAMWCVCLVWICMATLLNLLAIRTIFKLWMFGRVYKEWSFGEWRWQWFSKAGLGICVLIGAVTITAFAGTVTMLREARLLEIERGYWVPPEEGPGSVPTGY
ncbi:hypothetical protein TWF281_011370 [Arthrobotrys megalospora]